MEARHRFLPIVLTLLVPATGLSAVKKPTPAAKEATAAQRVTTAVDRLVGQAWSKQKIEPADLSTDAEFLRRLQLDLTGRIPSPAEVEAFTSDGNANKRQLLIDRLLAGDEFASHWARNLNAMLEGRVALPIAGRLAQVPRGKPGQERRLGRHDAGRYYWPGPVRESRPVPRPF